MLDGLFAVLLAETALFHAAEWQLVVDDLRRVDPGIPRLDAFGAGHGAVDVTGPDGGTQTENGVVRLLDGVVKVLDANDRQRRTEDLFVQHTRRWINVSHQRRLQVKTFVILVALESLGAE